MGGCGKTSLLGILVGRISNNVVEGSITYNDEIKNKSLKRRQWITFIQPEGRSYFNL
jgi:ABC-type multidrug transport system ATPase subunit